MIRILVLTMDNLKYVGDKLIIDDVDTSWTGEKPIILVNSDEPITHNRVVRFWVHEIASVTFIYQNPDERPKKDMKDLIREWEETNEQDIS